MSEQQEMCQLHVRIPVATYNRMREAVPERHGLGAFVNEAILALLDKQRGYTLEEIANAVVDKLQERLGK